MIISACNHHNRITRSINSIRSKHELPISVFEMVQWKAKSLFLLVFTFLTSLLIFNLCAFVLGKSISSLPFTPNSRGYSIHLENLSRKILPLTVESYPLSENTSYLSIWCGEEAEVNDYVISLKESYHVSIFSMCKDMTIEIWPRHSNIGFYAKSQKPIHSLIILLTRILLLSVISFTFYIFFSYNKNFSVMRSTLITQISCILIIDPFQIIQNILPSISIIHCIISTAGWWRACTELFAEYGPLVRPQASFYKYISAIPSVILFFSTAMETMCRFSFPDFMLTLGIIGGFIVPIVAIWFLIKAGHTSGKTALTVHILSGTLSLSICYYMKILYNCSEAFRESLYCQTLELTFIGGYALFQAIFQAGESQDESARLLPQKVRRYDKIDELLDVLGDIGDDPHFDLTQDEPDNKDDKNCDKETASETLEDQQIDTMKKSEDDSV